MVLDFLIEAVASFALVILNIYSVYRLGISLKGKRPFEHGVPGIGATLVLTSGFLFLPNNEDLHDLALTLVALGTALLLTPKVLAIVSQFFHRDYSRVN